jgi:hypothetical protein
MSEHTRVKGMALYDHLPYRENGFSWCKHCKKFSERLEVEFHEGMLCDWMKVVCGDCDKAIWVTKFDHDQWDKKKMTKEEYEDKYGIRVFVKDDKKCVECGKKTNCYDCVGYGGSILKKKGMYFWCSKKCLDKHDKREDKAWKKKKKNN